MKTAIYGYNSPEPNAVRHIQPVQVIVSD